MSFSSGVFLFLYLPIVMLGAWYFERIDIKKCNYWLLFASLFFYGWSGIRVLGLFVLFIIFNWFIVKQINTKAEKKKWLVIGIVTDVLVLIFFKYTNFIIYNLGKVLGNNYITKIVLPLGISFYTFQGISLLIDTYRAKKSQKTESLLAVALYISFYPQLVAGPIVRYSDIKEELFDRTIDINDRYYGFKRFLEGFCKKVILADTFGIVVDNIYAMDERGMIVAWIGAITYSLQIYFDFSGYSDMAIGMGRMLGFHFNENFNFPYYATSIKEFWKRWHISLSEWFRDYVYIPLGGNRYGQKRQCLNIFLVWILTGVWHGAEWTYIFWGFYYACLLLMEKRNPIPWFTEKIPLIIKRTMVYIIVVIGFVIFRSENISIAYKYIRSMFFWDSTFTIKQQCLYICRIVYNYGFYYLISAIGIFPIIPKIADAIEYKTKRIKYISMYIYIFVLFWAAIIYFISSTHNSFIYFNF